jgi:hypothetical protein
MLVFVAAKMPAIHPDCLPFFCKILRECARKVPLLGCRAHDGSLGTSSWVKLTFIEAHELLFGEPVRFAEIICVFLHPKFNESSHLALIM